eukprot:313558-Pelagomonas_calceolata.AAC.1
MAPRKPCLPIRLGKSQALMSQGNVRRVRVQRGRGLGSCTFPNEDNGYPKERASGDAFVFCFYINGPRPAL